MPRLIDDIRAAKHLQAPFFVGPRKAAAWSEHAAMIADTLRRTPESELPVVLIDNVADYYYTASDQEYWDIARDFPNLAPPFPLAWYEHRMPGTIHSKELGDTDVRHMVSRGRTGVLVRAVKPEDAQGEGIPASACWILWCELFIDYGWHNRPIEGPHGPMFLCLDGEGRLLERPWMQSFAEPGFETEIKSLMTWLHPVLLAISFLHCKNVHIEDNVVPKPLAKKYRQRNGVNPTGYKTLVIEPLKRILHTEGKAGQHGLAKAMHICRGHFRDYREGRGLFGKYKQLVWTPMTLRGTKGQQPPPREIQVKI